RWLRAGYVAAIEIAIGSVLLISNECLHTQHQFENMETLIPQIAQLLNNTLNPDHIIVGSATETLDRLSLLPDFPFALISIASGGQDQGQRIAAATYLKNFTRRHVDADGAKVSIEFRNRLVHATLLAEPAVLKVLIEAFRYIIVKEFVKENSWPELVPELRSVIQNSNYINESSNSQWKTINALTVLQSVLRPFQYFLDPKLEKEPVPRQLELIAQEILLPLLALFHNLVEKALSIRGRTEVDLEKILLLVCKCIYFSVRSHMPSALIPTLASFCQDLFRILDSLSFDTATPEKDYSVRMKTGKRSLIIFCALVTRHRKHSDKLMSNILNCASKIVKHSINVNKLDFPTERVVSLAFDVISHVLETGPGWRLVSPHFSSLIESAIFPALVINEKDISEWEDDPDEYLQKNLPSNLEEISGWREDLFTARKSAINLLGVISLSKGPPMSSNSSSISSIKRKKGDKTKGKVRHSYMGDLLVLPFLSKFPVPSDATASQTNISNDYYGVLMAFGGLLDFLRERGLGYVTTLVVNRVLPVYSLSTCLPYLVAAANWVLGELASCLPEEISADIYSSLLKALVMPDVEDISCYPVRASAAGAIIELLENDYFPPEWLPLLQSVISRTDSEDDNESSILFQLLSSVVEAGSDNVIVHIPYIVSSIVGVISKHITPVPEPWPQVVERGFSALAVMAQILEDSVPEEIEENETHEKSRSDCLSVARAFSVLLRQVWLTPVEAMEEEVSNVLPPPSCINDASKLLRFIMRFVTVAEEVLEMKVSELLTVWADLIADWHAWEEMEDLSIFDCINEVVHLCKKCDIKNFYIKRMPSPPAPPVPQCSIIEGIGAFVTDAINQYPSATWKACSCVHLLLHVPKFSSEIEGVQQSLVIAFSQAAFLRFRQIQSKPSALWKPLLLVISSCYLCYPDTVEKVLEKDGSNGFTAWASALSFISTTSYEPGLSAESEIKLIVMALVKVVERLLGPTEEQGCGLVRDCYVSLMETVIRLKEVRDEEEIEDEEADDDEEDEDEETDDEDSEDDEHEETEEEFLDRYAKASISLSNGIEVEEGDIEDQDQELELGMLDEFDQERAALSLIERYNHIFMKRQSLPPQLVTGFLNTFPEYSSLFLNS
ncbi:importin beta-like SAD2-like protein, partial [Thalictrum thalictroides]